MSNIYVGSDRRESERVSCSAALHYQLLSAKEFSEAVDRLDKKRHRLHLLDLLTQPSQEELDRFIAIGKEHPLVARHLQAMAEKLDAVGKLLAGEGEQLNSRPTHNIVVSATGLSFHAPTSFHKGAVMELQIRLFPDKRRILMIAEVISCEQTSEGSKNFNVALRFNYIAEADMDFLVSYIGRVADNDSAAEG